MDVRGGCHLLQLQPRTPPAQMLELRPEPGDPGSLLRQGDVAATFPFAGSASSKAEHVA